MYRRRIIAIFLSLALVASCFVISVSAEEEAYQAFSVTINGTRYFLTEGTSFLVEIQPNDTYTLNIQSFGTSFGVYDNLPIICNFDLRVYMYVISGTTSTDLYANNLPNIYNSDVQCRLLTTYTYQEHFPELDYYPTQYGYRFSCYVTDTSYLHAVNANTVWRNLNTSKHIYVLFKFENIQINFGWNWFFHAFYLPIMTQVQNTLDSIKAAAMSLNQAFVVNDNYSYNTIWYDQDGNAHVSEVLDVNWIDSIQGMLFAISQPVVQQVQQEQMAKDAGFEDVLDDAYDKSNPGSFLDLLDIGDLADWNEQSFSGSLSDGFLYWFSQSCADDIDTVPVVRGQEPQVIDFYTQHMNDYWEALTNDTADQGGD